MRLEPRPRSSGSGFFSSFSFENIPVVPRTHGDTVALFRHRPGCTSSIWQLSFKRKKKKKNL